MTRYLHAALIGTLLTSAPLVAAPPAAPAFDKSDPKAYGLQIATHWNAVDTGWKDEVTTGRMTLFDSDNRSVKRSFVRMAYERSDKGDKIINRFSAPAEIKGVAALTYENPGNSDDNWIYLPSNRRVRRISGANNTASFLGTEFTYEDLSSIDPREYRWRFLEETVLKQDSAKVFKLEAIPTYPDTGYTKMLVYINVEHWRIEQIQFFDKARLLLKTRKSSRWKRFHGRYWREAKIEMINHQNSKRTVIEFEKTFVNMASYDNPKTGGKRKNLAESLFTTQSLGK